MKINELTNYKYVTKCRAVLLGGGGVLLTRVITNVLELQPIKLSVLRDLKFDIVIIGTTCMSHLVNNEGDV